jgi:membrane protease subunit HflC
MKSKRGMLISLIISFFICLNSFVIVNQTEQVIILQFGKPVKVIKDAGLNFKIPFIQTNISFDNRLLDLVVNDKEVITLDQKRLIVNSFAKFRIINPLDFYNAFRGNMYGKSVFVQLNNMLESSLREVIGSFSFMRLLSTERANIMQDIEDKLNVRIKQYGIEIIDTRIMRADLPSANSNAIFRRMQTERELEAKQIRAEGEESAEKIIAETAKTRAIMLAEANKQARILRGEGEARATEIFNNAFGRDQNFYEFYKSMQVYKKTINSKNSKIVITTNNELYKLLGF